jgi:hypothetical protein
LDLARPARSWKPGNAPGAARPPPPVAVAVRASAQTPPTTDRDEPPKIPASRPGAVAVRRSPSGVSGFHEHLAVRSRKNRPLVEAGKRPRCRATTAARCRCSSSVSPDSADPRPRRATHDPRETPWRRSVARPRDRCAAPTSGAGCARSSNRIGRLVGAAGLAASGDRGLLVAIGGRSPVAVARERHVAARGARGRFGAVRDRRCLDCLSNGRPPTSTRPGSDRECAGSPSAGAPRPRPARR